MQENTARINSDKGYYSYKEIAKVLGGSVDSIKGIEKRALAKIRMFRNRNKLSHMKESMVEINNGVRYV